MRREQRSWGRILLFAGAMLGLVPAGFGQGGGVGAGSAGAYVPTMTFDVASIRESKPGSSYTMSSRNSAHGSQFSMTNVDVTNLITLAYGVESFQVTGVPEWAKAFTARFTVEARSEVAVDEALGKLSDAQAGLEKRHMLQALLTERMKLKVHLETREESVFALAVGKGGPKLREVKAGIRPADGDKNLEDGKQPKWGQRCDVKGCQIKAQRMSMALLARLLTGQLSAFVRDETGLGGNYEFTLDYIPPGGTGYEDSEVPSLLTAVQDQLGLKLERGKGSMPMLVVERLERPSEN